MIARQALPKVLELAAQMKAVCIVGPRQSGKTTLCRHGFPDKPYVSLENPASLKFATEDPQRFLAQYRDGAIFDEIQRAPELFSWLQGMIDERPEARGRFILSGSNNFLLLEKITQTLAGRVGYLDLLPFSLAERRQRPEPDGDDLDTVLFRGGYPPIVADGIDPQNWFPAYTRTYVERDVRQIRNVQNLQQFFKFVTLCAARIGSPFNLAHLATDMGLDRRTLGDWLSILQASYILWLLPPYHENFNKRILKTPKVYFYDTGLAAYLLDLATPRQLAVSQYRGALFENFVLTELLKYRFNQGRRANLYYWQDSNGREVDVVIKAGQALYPVEIKAGHTPRSDYFKNILYWNNLSGNRGGAVVYGGDETQERGEGLDLVSWRALAEMPARLGL